MEREGSFLCPNCGIKISPNDHSDDAYSIYDVTMNKDNQIDELVLCCSRCSTIIHLTGFSEIKNTGLPTNGIEKLCSPNDIESHVSKARHVNKPLKDAQKRKSKQVPIDFGCLIGFTCF